MRPVILAIFAGLLIPASAPAQAPKPGDVQKLSVVTVALQATGTRDEAKRVTYTPPPGWHIRSHEVVVTARRGAVSYSVGTVPAGWTFSAEGRVTESAKKSAEAVAESHGVGAKAKAQTEASRDRSQTSTDGASHHALVVEATAKGAGLFQGSGALELTVVAELVYVGGRAPGQR